MNLVFHSLYVSPHHLSFAREVAKRIGSEEFRYIYVKPLTAERLKLGWGEDSENWITSAETEEGVDLLERCEVLVSGLRDIDLFERRSKKGLLTIYSNERWFKPIPILGLLIPGWIRLLVPWYFRMAWRFAKLLRSDQPFYYFPISIWAARDMAFMCRWFGNITFERRAGGKVWAGRRLLEKFRMCAYFVDSSERQKNNDQSRKLDAERTVLWVGRIINVKRVGDIVKAVSRAAQKGLKIRLDIYGHGDEEQAVKKLAKECDYIHFYDPVPISDVRRVMREHDIYVLASNAIEGWGAVINEAMEEGIRTIGTFEAGASSTLLPERCLYHAGDITALTSLLQSDLPCVEIGGWSCKAFADFLVHIARNKKVID